MNEKVQLWGFDVTLTARCDAHVYIANGRGDSRFVEVPLELSRHPVTREPILRLNPEPVREVLDELAAEGAFLKVTPGEGDDYIDAFSPAQALIEELGERAGVHSTDEFFDPPWWMALADMIRDGWRVTKPERESDDKEER